MPDSIALEPSDCKAIVYVLAKEPVPGAVKTRLIPDLSPASAAAAAKAFLEDTIEALVGLPGVLVRLATSPCPDGTLDQLEDLARSYGIDAGPQGGGDLGARMERVMLGGFAGGETGRVKVVLVGGDTPDLPRSRLTDALLALETRDVAIGPSEDGGYYLIGARRRIPGLFSVGVPWSGPEVFRATEEACRRAGATTSVLAAWPDIDDIHDFSAFMERCEGRDGREASPASRSYAVGAELRRQGAAL